MSLRYSVITDTHSLLRVARRGCEFCDSEEKEEINTSFSVIETDIPDEKVYTKGKDFQEINNYVIKDLIIFPHSHSVKICDLSTNTLSGVLLYIKKRMLELRRNKDVRYVCFYIDIDASGHLIFRVMGLNSYPAITSTKMFGLSSYDIFLNKNQCWACDLINVEKKAGSRVLDETENFIVLSSFAARYPFELSILPKKHTSFFEDISTGSMIEFSDLLLDTAWRYSNYLGQDDIMLILSGFPVNNNPPNLLTHKKYFHCHVEIIPKMFEVSALQLSAAIYDNWCSPEMAIDILQGKEN